MSERTPLSEEEALSIAALADNFISCAAAVRVSSDAADRSSLVLTASAFALHRALEGFPPEAMPTAFAMLQRQVNEMRSAGI